MAFFIVCSVAFGASLLTFFTGFGLGTLLLPAFAIFFPAETAVGLTAVVHFLNGLFKLVLMRRNIDARVALRFGIPAVLAAFAGAWLLSWLAHLEPLFTHTLFGRPFRVMPVAFVVACLMAIFAALELWPRMKQLAVPPRYLPLGGLVTGFFGGLSGHQGALRSVFLLRAGLDKKHFIGTAVAIAVAIDSIRLAVYSERFLAAEILANKTLIGAAVLAAFAGALTGNRLLEKVTLRTIEIAVSVLLLFIAAGLALGLL
jgi:uncharacterized membrane protein YfcA